MCRWSHSQYIIASARMFPWMFPYAVCCHISGFRHSTGALHAKSSCVSSDRSNSEVSKCGRVISSVPFQNQLPVTVVLWYMHCVFEWCAPTGLPLNSTTWSSCSSSPAEELPSVTIPISFQSHVLTYIAFKRAAWDYLSETVPWRKNSTKAAAKVKKSVNSMARKLITESAALACLSVYQR